MAQNVNPFSSTQNTPTKAAEEKQSLPKDNHAVSKRYVQSSPLAGHFKRELSYFVLPRMNKVNCQTIKKIVLDCLESYSMINIAFFLSVNYIT